MLRVHIHRLPYVLRNSGLFGLENGTWGTGIRYVGSRTVVGTLLSWWDFHGRMEVCGWDCGEGKGMRGVDDSCLFVCLLISQGRRSLDGCRYIAVLGTQVYICLHGKT